MRLDVHTHCDTTDTKQVREFVNVCQRRETQVCIFSVGSRSDHHYCPNEEVLQVAKEYPDTMIPFAFVDQGEPFSDPDLPALREAGFRGLKCTSPYYSYDHDAYMPLYEQAEKLGMPMLFHTGRYRANPGDRQRRRPSVRNMQPLTLDRVARSFPDLKIIMAHLGTSLFRHEAADLLKLHPNLFADLAGSGSWQALSPEALAALLRPPVPGGSHEFRYFEKLLLGSDAYTSIPRLVEQAQDAYENLLAEIGVPQPVWRQVMGATAANLISENAQS
jgi:predicted TIM-barrel fold metal-dependent hydrolase